MQFCVCRFFCPTPESLQSSSTAPKIGATKTWYSMRTAVKHPGLNQKCLTLKSRSLQAPHLNIIQARRRAPILQPQDKWDSLAALYTLEQHYRFGSPYCCCSTRPRHALTSQPRPAPTHPTKQKRSKAKRYPICLS